MSLNLQSVKGDGDDNGKPARKLVATYQIKSVPGPGSSTSSGKSYWFDIEVTRDTNYQDTGYVVHLTIDTPVQPTFKAALEKLAEWAGQVASGIIECGELPTDSFPLEMKAPDRDGFGFATAESADLYGALYDPPRVHEENYYDANGKPGGEGFTYYFIEVPRSGVIVPKWGGTYPAPLYRGRPPKIDLGDQE